MLQKMTNWILAISLAFNAVLCWAFLHERDAATVAATVEQQATGAAQACSDGTAKLAQQAQQRHAAAAPKIEQARQQAAAANKRADAILRAPTADPGNDCSSALARVNGWWNERHPK